MSNSSIWPIDRILSDVTTPALSGPGSDDNGAVRCILQSSGITGASTSDYLMSYSEHSLATAAAGGILLLCRDAVVFYSLSQLICNQWYMHKPESVQENEMHKILWVFTIQMDHPIPAWRPESFNKKKRIHQLVDFAIPMQCRVKMKENEMTNSRTLPEGWKSYGTWMLQRYQL